MGFLEATARPVPTPWLGRFRQRLFGVAPEETSPERRGFRVHDSQLIGRFERVGETFLWGYHAGLGDPSAETLARNLGAVDSCWRGFAFEGAGLAMAILDGLDPFGRDRVDRLVKGPGEPHRYLVNVGAGWMLARLPRSPDWLLNRLDPLLGWLSLDGYGFYHGYFAWPKSVVKQRVPRRLKGYQRRVFDQGLGRSLWFVEGADPDRLRATINTFDEARHADLWSGVGLAAAYAGGLNLEGVARLRRNAGVWADDVAQGAAFAAEARIAGHTPADHLDGVCLELCGCPPAQAAEVTRQAQIDLPADGPLPAFEIWRRRIRTRLNQLRSNPRREEASR